MIRISVLIKEVPESCLALLPCDGRWLQLWKKQSLTNTWSVGTLVLDFPVSRAVRNSLLVSISSPVYGILWEQSEQPPPPFFFPFVLPFSSRSPFLPLPDINISIQTLQMSKVMHYRVCEPGLFHVTPCSPTLPIFLQTTPFCSSSLSDAWVPHFFIHPYADGLPGWSQNLAVVTSAAINLDCRSFLWLADFSFFRHYLELTDMAASYGSSIKTTILKPIMKYLFLRKLH